MISIVNKYILKEYAKVLGVVISGLTTIVFIVEFVEKIRKFWGAEAIHITQYFLYHIPKIIFMVAPVAVLLSVLLFFGILNRNLEIVALRSSGISSKRLALPVLFVALMVSLLLVTLNLHFIPEMNRKAVLVKEVLIEKHQRGGRFNQNLFWFRYGNNKIYNIKRIDLEAKQLLGLTVYTMNDNGGLSSVTVIDTLKYLNKNWVISTGKTKHFHQDGSITEVVVNDVIYPLKKDIEDFKGLEKNTEMVSYKQLKEYTNTLEKDGYNADKYKVEQFNKIAFPFASIIITLIAAPIGLKGGSMRSGISVGIGKGIAVTFAYWLIHSISLSLGNGGVLPSLASTWVANIIFLIAGLYMFIDIDYHV